MNEPESAQTGRRLHAGCRQDDSTKPENVVTVMCDEIGPRLLASRRQPRCVTAGSGQPGFDRLHPRPGSPSEMRRNVISDQLEIGLELVALAEVHLWTVRTQRRAAPAPPPSSHDRISMPKGGVRRERPNDLCVVTTPGHQMPTCSLALGDQPTDRLFE